MKNSKEAQALAALLAFPTVREASGASGIPERTLWRYLGNSEFTEKLEAERAKLVSTASDRLKSKLDAATRAIADVMEDTDAPPQTRVNAARTIFEFALRYSEMADVVARLERLERHTGADNGT